MSNEVKGDFEKAQRVAEIDSEIQRLENQIDNLKDERKEIEQELLESFQEKGISNISVNGRTIYIHSQYWAGYKNSREEAVKALKRAGLEEYVRENYNTHSLSAYIRELIADYEDEKDEPVSEPEAVLPPDLKDEIKVTEKIQLRSRRK